MIQVWKPKHSATVIRLDSVFAHGDGLPCRRIGTTANRLVMQAVGEDGQWENTALEHSERYRLLTPVTVVSRRFWAEMF